MKLLKPDDKSQVDAIFRMHVDLLPQSRPSRLGRIFMKYFYLTTLVRLKIIQGLLFEFKNQYVGFSLFTKYPNRFIYLGIKKTPIYFMLVLILMLLDKPKLLIEIISIIKEKRKISRNPINCNKTGQWLTFGVDKNYLKYIDKKGRRISSILVDETIQWFDKQKFDRIIAAVRKNNIPAILFYNSLGITMEKNNNSRNEYYTFSIDLKK